MLVCDRLVKKFGEFTALSGISFRIEAGDIFGFIGPNGAGKTTTIRILAGLSLPTEGDAVVDGVSVVQRPEAARRRVGYMPDYFGAYDHTTVWEYLDFFAASYGLDRGLRRRRIEDAVALTDLDRVRDVDVAVLSRGMKQRVSLARALLHDPAVLLLDEPASGLDPRARIEFRALLRELGRMGKTILISSHILTELSDFVTRVGIIERGQIVACGTPREVTQAAQPGFRFRLRVVSDRDAAQRLLKEDPRVREVAAGEDDCLFGTFDGDAAAASDIVTRLVQAGLRVMAFGETAIDLEDVFLRVTKGIVE
jgi:ABC-2 type transport system ATP-binding protein